MVCTPFISQHPVHTARVPLSLGCYRCGVLHGDVGVGAEFWGSVKVRSPRLASFLANAAVTTAGVDDV